MVWVKIHNVNNVFKRRTSTISERRKEKKNIIFCHTNLYDSGALSAFVHRGRRNRQKIKLLCSCLNLNFSPDVGA